MLRAPLRSIAVSLFIATTLFAADPPARPPTNLDEPQTLLQTVDRLSARIEALEAQVKDLQQLLAAQGTTRPQAIAPATQPAGNSWLVTVTAIVTQPTDSIQQELLAQQIKLTGGQKAQTDAGGAFTQGRTSSNVRTQTDAARNFDRTAGGPLGRVEANANAHSTNQRDFSQSGSSASVGPGVAAAYHDDSLETRLASERDTLRRMQGDWEMRQDNNGNQYRVNKYSNQQLGQQQIVVTQLENERTHVQQRITTLQRELDKARSTALITGVIDDGQTITATAPQLLATLARSLAPGQKVRIDGVVTKKGPNLEVTARAIVPMN